MANDRTAREISESFAEFNASDQLLLSQADMARYPSKWVAAYRGKVVAAEPDLITVRMKLIAGNWPLATTAIRFIESDGKASV